LIPDSTPGVWLLNVYNTDGIGTDRTTLTTPQIFGEESVGGARMYRRHPPGSNVAVEGSGQLSSRISSAGALTAYGLRETYVPDLDITTTADASLKATQTITAYLRKSQPLTLARQPRDVDPFPFVAYFLGDTVNVSEPPFMAKDGRRLVQVVWALTGDGETVSESFGAVTYTGQAAVNQGVYQLLNEFKPIREVDPFIPVQAGGGGVIPWLVAAANAPVVWQSAAGWICTGVDDDQVVQAAYDAGWSFIMLSPGTFDFNMGNLAFVGGSDSIIHGCGPAQTVVELSGTAAGSDRAAFDVAGISDVQIVDSTGASAGTNVIGVRLSWNNGFVRNCEITTTGTAVQVANNYVTVEGSYLVGGGLGVSFDFAPRNTLIIGNLIAAPTCVNPVGQYCRIVDNILTSCTVGVLIGSTDAFDNLLIQGNIIESFTENGVRLNLAGVSFNSPFQIVGNTIWVGTGAGGGAATNAGVYVLGNGTNTPAFNVSDNVFHDLANQSAIIVEAVEGGQVVDNLIQNVGRNGIVLDDANDMNVAGNNIGWAFASNKLAANNTYDGIRLEGDSDRNLIEHNKVWGTGQANKFRYALNVSAATCDINAIVGNDLRPAGNFATGQYNDAGTGTVNAYPAGAAGDNFI
jgi:hypothetical protein